MHSSMSGRGDRRADASCHSSRTPPSSTTDGAAWRPVGSTPASRERSQESAIGTRTCGRAGDPRRRSRGRRRSPPTRRGVHAPASPGSSWQSTATQGLCDTGPRPPRRRSASSVAGRPTASWQRWQPTLASPPVEVECRSREECFRMSTVAQQLPADAIVTSAPAEPIPVPPAIRRCWDSPSSSPGPSRSGLRSSATCPPPAQASALPIILMATGLGLRHLDGLGGRARADARRVHLRAVRRLLAELRGARARPEPQLVRDPGRGRDQQSVALFLISWADRDGRADRSRRCGCRSRSPRSSRSSSSRSCCSSSGR